MPSLPRDRLVEGHVVLRRLRRLLHVLELRPLSAVPRNEVEEPGEVVDDHTFCDSYRTGRRPRNLAFGHRLGGTPQPVLLELWIALPSLQQLLEFKNGWRFAQEAWGRRCRRCVPTSILVLFWYSRIAPDVLNYPTQSCSSPSRRWQRRFQVRLRKCDRNKANFSKPKFEGFGLQTIWRVV
ncbi:hypothetical protein DFH06DRAFT_6981 [Mycena polygramma]|nr:hypothetical protein DFH06DRAFT_6981 [Mycena polygramma]